MVRFYQTEVLTVSYDPIVLYHVSQNYPIASTAI